MRYASGKLKRIGAVLKFQKLPLLFISILYNQSPLLAFDYKFSGVAESVSKVGFNHSKLNSKEADFPYSHFCNRHDQASSGFQSAP